MSAHTPGPWAIETEDRYTSIVFGGVIIAEIDSGEAEYLDNARLIAAAPELLAACEDALVFLESWKDLSGGDAYRKALAAITKATGVTE